MALAGSEIDHQRAGHGCQWCVVGWPDFVVDLLGDLVTSSYPSLTRALAEVLVDVLRFVDGSEDEEMDQDDALRVMEGVAHVVGALTGGQWQELVGLVGEMAAAETDPDRREFLGDFPEGFGLIDGDC
ncbi:hypothetical protein ACFYUL_14935 [Streptomyces sp. NPDC004311]|uniref:hypothetical protein n=1 Tax=Streptomyces sp. NPDC004311 TaxID=3364698 RepID=UPI0036D16CB2